MKTAKFSEVVKKCGEPAIYLAWVDPARDKTLKRALSEHRVMTLHQELHGGKKDFGSVGFLKDRHAQLLVFPKSLRRFAERKVIAIDYSLIAKDQLSAGVDSLEKLEKETRAVRVKSRMEHRPARKSKSAPSKSKVAPRSKVQPARRNPPMKTLPDRDSVKKILSEVERAVADLSAGKSVPAYKRLTRLLEASRDYR